MRPTGGSGGKPEGSGGKPGGSGGNGNISSPGDNEGNGQKCKTRFGKAIVWEVKEQGQNIDNCCFSELKNMCKEIMSESGVGDEKEIPNSQVDDMSGNITAQHVYSKITFPCGMILTQNIYVINQNGTLIPEGINASVTVKAGTIKTTISLENWPMCASDKNTTVIPLWIHSKGGHFQTLPKKGNFDISGTTLSFIDKVRNHILSNNFFYHSVSFLYQPSNCTLVMSSQLKLHSLFTA